MKPAAGLMLLVAWTASWVWVVRTSGWVPLLPLWAWLLLILLSALPLESVYRWARPR